MDFYTSRGKRSAKSIKRSMSVRALPPVPRPSVPIYTDVALPGEIIGSNYRQDKEKVKDVNIHSGLQAGIDTMYDTPLCRLLTAFRLPTVVKLTGNYMDSGSDMVIRKDELLLLHFLRRENQSILCDRHGQLKRLSTKKNHLYDILPDDPAFDDKVFLDTMSVIECNPLPKELRVTKIDPLSTDGNVRVGALLRISHVERKVEGSQTHCMLVGTCNGRPFKISQYMMLFQYSALVTEKPLSLSEIVNKSRLPMRVRRVDTKVVYKLLECKFESSVVATRMNQELALSIPVSCPMALQKVEDLVVENFLKGMLPALYPLMRCVDNVHELDSVNVTKNGGHNQSSIDEKLPEKVNTLRRGSLPDTLSHTISHMTRSRKDSYPANEEEVSSNKPSSSFGHSIPSPERVPKNTKKPVVPLKQHVNQTVAISSNNRPPLPKKTPLPNSKKLPVSYGVVLPESLQETPSSGEKPSLLEEQLRSQKKLLKAPRDTPRSPRESPRAPTNSPPLQDEPSDLIYDDVETAAQQEEPLELLYDLPPETVSSLTVRSPPGLPSGTSTNDLSSSPQEPIRPLYEMPEDSLGTPQEQLWSSQESSSSATQSHRSPQEPAKQQGFNIDLRNADMEQVAEFLKYHHFDLFIETFRDENITGELLCELDETVLQTELHMPRIQAKRLMNKVRNALN